MDVKEKLVEILQDENNPVWRWFPNNAAMMQLADYLVSNGVTVRENVEISDELLKQLKNAPITICKEEPSIELVQEWIPVTERLPKIPDGWVETPEPVLYMMKNTKTIYAGYYGEGGVWRDKYFRQYADSRNGVDADDVLCWMYQHDLPPSHRKEND